MNHYTIGVDIGGTNTDAVLMNRDQHIIAKVKTATTEPISYGFSKAIRSLLEKGNLPKTQIQSVLLGTTQATNAILQHRDLFRVGIIRIAGHHPDSLPSGSQWPQGLKSSVIAGTETIDGGFQCNGRPITPFNPQQARAAIDRLIYQGAESFAVVGVFSPLNSSQEQQVAEMIDHLPVSLSSEIGGVGFIERENSTILNAALKKVMAKGFKELQQVCESLSLTCPLLITQNDGSLITMERAIDYPILTISAGPTNSFRGAARLAGVDQAVIIDIGGTSSDAGLIINSFPRRSLSTSTIGGVRLNFPMPDVLSIGLGGGSCVTSCGSAYTIGPQSVAKDLWKEAQAFGGKQLTLTDAALVLGNLAIPDANPAAIQITNKQAKVILDQALGQIERLTTLMRGENTKLPVVVVGGGATLFESHKSSLPEYYDVANAYGAALAEVSGTIDTVVSLTNRAQVLEKLQQEACEHAIRQGAEERSLRLVDQQIIPFHYVPNHMARVIIRASGKRQL